MCKYLRQIVYVISIGVLAALLYSPDAQAECGKDQIRVKFRSLAQVDRATGHWTLSFDVSDSCPSSDMIEEFSINYTYKVRRVDGTVYKSEAGWATAIHPNKSHETVVDADRFLSGDEIITDV